MVVGCGGSADNLDCEYLAGDNCYKTTASAAASCLPADTDTGVLAADNSTCTYASGHVVTFNPALTLPLPSMFDSWNFTITDGSGAPCLHYEDSGDGFDLTVGNDTVSETLVGNAGLEISCPDGTTFSNSNALELLSCPGSNFGNLPGNTTSSGTTSVHFALLNTGADTLTLFDCSR